MRVTQYKTLLDTEKLAYLVKEASFNYPKLENQFTLPQQIYHLLTEVFHLSEQTEEYCYLLCLNMKCRLLGVFELTHGSVNTSVFSNREIFQKALLCNATNIVFAHNHPSGDCTPSKEDIDCMKKLKQAGLLMGIPLIDSVIIGENSYFSFKEQGMI